MKRSILSVLSVFLITLTLAGCEKPKNSSNSTPSSTSSQGEDKNPQEKPFTEKVRSLGGKTIKLASFWSEWSGGDSASAAQQEVAKQLDDIEKDYDCKIERIGMAVATYEQDIAVAIQSGLVYANLISIQTEHAKIFNSGNIADVKTIQNLDLSNNKWEDIASIATTRGNKQFGVGFNMSQQDSMNRTILAFNKDLAAQYEIEDIYGLVRENKWTYEKFAQISQDIVTKSNGAVQGLIDGFHCFKTMANTNNIELVKTVNGKATYNGTSEPVLQAFQFFQDYNKNGLLNTKDYVGNDYGLSESNVFMSGKTLFHMADYWIVSQVLASGMPDDYGVIPLPKGPNADKITGIVSNTRFFTFIKGDPDIEDAATILVAIANRTGISKKQWIENQADTSLRDDESIEMLEIMLNNEIPITSQNMMPAKYHAAAEAIIYDMSKTPKQALEEIAQVAQENIDKFYANN